MPTAQTARPAVLRLVDEQFDDAVRVLREMIEFPSVGPWFGEPAEVSGERAIQAYLRRHLEGPGAVVDEWEPSSADALAGYSGGPGYFADRDFTGRPNLVGRISAGGVPVPELMLLGHCDVVPGGPGWTGGDPLGGCGRVRAEIEAMLADFVAGDAWLEANPPVVRWLVDADCGETDDTEPIVTAPVAVMRSLGTEPVIQGVPCHTDMGLPIKAGVPSITFGPGRLSVAHQSDEHLLLDEHRDAIRIMALTIVELCGA